MDEGARFLILSLEGELYAIPITLLLEIKTAGEIRKDPNLTELFEGTFEFRGKGIPVVSAKKILKLPGKPGTALLVLKSRRGTLGLLVDAVMDILDTSQKPITLPPGVMSAGSRYYDGILRHKEKLVLLLNDDGLLP
jgi:purine-binding chemotaxis protein CheW